MKVYIFYRKYDTGLVPSIYAYTMDKNIFEEFKKVRNMDKFIINKIDMSEDEAEEFERKYRRYLLGYRYYETYDRSMIDGISNNLAKRTVKIVSTEFEEEEVYSQFETMLALEFGKITLDVSVFNEEIKKALIDLGYYDLFKFYTAKFNIFMEGFHHTYPDYNQTRSFYNDYFGLFIKLNKWSM